MNESRTDSTGPDAERVAQLATELRALRETAGNPSFRKMSAASGYISHTTLHEAATGNRLPSWETTREFVRACGGEEGEWRARWDLAKNGPKPAAADTPERNENGSTAVTSVPSTRWWLLAALGGVVLVAATATTMTVLGDSDAAEPEPSKNGPMYPGDFSTFITDVTIPDQSVVQVNEKFLKVWEIQNSGSVVWQGRSLERTDLPIGPDDCVTPERIELGDTLPNERVKVSVSVTARDTPGECMVKWKMVDREGRQTFPGSRPIYFWVHVQA